MIEARIARMKANQVKSAKALIRNICCNFDAATGLCLRLDAPCPQLVTRSVLCLHFKNVLLEDRDGQLLKAQVFHDSSVKACESCGQPFRSLSNRGKFCSRCAAKRRLERQREYMSGKRLNGG